MSPKSYSYLWLLCFISAGILWLAGGLTMTAIVVYGFIAFGMTFMGMMCVLPGMVSHPAPKRVNSQLPKTASKPAHEKQVSAARGFSVYRSV